MTNYLDFLKKDFIYSFVREMGRERNISVGLPLCRMPPAGDLAHNRGMFPDWELNQRPFGLQAGTQSTEPHQPGLIILISIFFISTWRLFILVLISEEELGSRGRALLTRIQALPLLPIHHFHLGI